MAWYSFNQEGVELRESSKASSPFFICGSFNLNIILNILDTFHYHVAVFFLINWCVVEIIIHFIYGMYVNISAMYDLIVSGLLDFIKKYHICFSLQSAVGLCKDRNILIFSNVM